METSCGRVWTVVGRGVTDRVWPCVRVFIEFQIAPCPCPGWGKPYRASPTIAPMEWLKEPDDTRTTQSSPWTQFLMTSFLGSGERRYHDGDEENGEQERGWAEQEDG